MSEEKKYLPLNDVEAYKKSFYMSNFVWELAIKWKNPALDTIGKQFIRALDSISANIAEGFGRFGKREKIYFYRVARASAFECLDWTAKAKNRSLISEEQYEYLIKEFKNMPLLINQWIKYTNKQLKE
jgi:four helix bundle protein